jgi:antitoxin VapB
MMKISVFEYVFHSTWRLRELEEIMRTVSIFKNGNNRAIRLPRDMDFEGVSELEIVREGDRIILRPVRPTWGSFAKMEKADPDFMAEREDVVSDEGRVDL